MKKYKWDFIEVLNNKTYVMIVAFTLFLSYGFQAVRFSIGIDDTAVSLYFDDGVAPGMGRWVLYLLNKFLYLTKPAPFLTESVGALLLFLSAVVYSVLLKKIIGDAYDNGAMIVSSCIFVSYPLISFVFRYYLHNGVGLANLFTALSLFLFYDSLWLKGWNKLPELLESGLLVLIALGCYESFAIVYILGIFVILYLKGACSSKVRFSEAFIDLVCGALTIAFAVVMRSIIIKSVVFIFNISIDELNTVGLRGIKDLFWLFNSEYSEGLSMLIKRFAVVYHLNGFVFFPIFLYEISCLLFLIGSIVYGIKHKTGVYFLLYLGMIIIPFSLTFIEGKVTFYRSCQFLPFFSSIGMGLLYILAKRLCERFKSRKVLPSFVYILFFTMIYNSVVMINSNFYMEYREYKYSEYYLMSVSHDIEERYGRDYPVVFVGNIDMPYEFVKEYYVGYDDKRYIFISRIMDLVDIHLKEKYWQPQGYCFLNEGTLPMIRWALTAFDGTNMEMMEFLKMHGVSFLYVSDADRYKEICDRAEGLGLPDWPQEGSILLWDGYVIVNL